MKHKEDPYSAKSERDLTIISTIALILCVAILADSLIYFFVQVNTRAALNGQDGSPDKLIIIITLASLLLLILGFIRTVSRMRTELRIQKVQHSILQSISKVSTFEYNKDSDLLIHTYSGPEGAVEKRETEGFFRGEGYLGFIRNDSQKDYYDMMRFLLAAPETDTSEYPITNYRGEFRWHRIASQSVADDRGSVIRIVGSGIDVDDLVTARDAALAVAATDAMTGLLGKTAFASRAAQRMRNPKAAAPTLLMIDFDDFKSINDTQGHLEGDRLLAAAAMLLQRVFSADDLLGRFGGDEFIVFMQGISREMTEKKILHFMRRLSEIEDGAGHRITCSIGAFCEDRNDMAVDELLKKADEAMYEAKRSGKNNYKII